MAGTLEILPNAPRPAGFLSAINDIEYIDFPNYPETDGDIQGVYKFNGTTHQWTSVLDKQWRSEDPLQEANAYDEECGVLYYSTPYPIEGDVSLTAIDLKTRSGEICWHHDLRARHLSDSVYLSALLVIDDELHVFVQIDGEAVHSVCNKSTGKGIKAQKIYDGDMVIMENAIHSKARNSIIAYGFDGSPRSEDTKAMICEYSLFTKQWATWNCLPMPKIDCTKAMICTNDGRYVMSFGGSAGPFSDFHRKCDWIIVYDAEQQQSSRSAVRIPTDNYVAITMMDRKQDNVLVHGFVNQSFKQPDFKDLPPMPLYMTQMMAKWFCREYVHLRSTDNTMNVRINVDNILAIRSQIHIKSWQFRLCNTSDLDL